MFGTSQGLSSFSKDLTICRRSNGFFFALIITLDVELGPKTPGMISVLTPPLMVFALFLG